MYKKQMILQRIVSYGVLVAAALVFIYSLGLMTDMYDSKFNYYAENINSPMVPGTEVYYHMQEFNQNLTGAGIVLILLAVSQFLFRNHVRRKYYIANYITVGANTLAAVAVSVWALSNIFTYKIEYLAVDFEKMKEYAELFKFSYTTSTFWFDISIAVFGILLLVTVVNVGNLVWKRMLMKAERELLADGKEV